MRKLIFVTVLASTLLAAVITDVVSAGSNHIQLQQSRIIDTGTLLQSGSHLCPLKGMEVMNLKFECQRCCDLGDAAYNACRRQRANTVCDCIETARNICIGEGCGPCLCCDYWQTKGEQFQCWPRK